MSRIKEMQNQRAVEVEDRVLRNQRILKPSNHRKPRNYRSQLSRSGSLACWACSTLGQLSACAVMQEGWGPGRGEACARDLEGEKTK